MFDAVASPATERAGEEFWSHAPWRLASARKPQSDLPAPLAFLRDQGFADARLDLAAREARRSGADPVATLIATGGATEDEYYAALARHLGLAFTSRPEVLGQGPLDPRAIEAGVAPLFRGPARFIAAPRGEKLATMLKLHASRSMSNESLVLTTPRRFDEWARASAGVAVAEDASAGLSRLDADLSARAGATPAQFAVICAIVATVVGSLALSHALWLVCIEILSTILAASVLLRLCAVAEARRSRISPTRSPPDAQLPVYTIVAPLYREAEVARKLLSAIERLDYPRAKLDVKFVVEADDAMTQCALAACDPPAWCEIIVAPPGAPRTKPRALNVALPVARGELLTVYDAEDEPEPDQLRLAAARFAAAPREVACLQARLAIDNSADSWLAGLFALEYAALFDVINPGIAGLGLPMPLGGTSNHFRVGALREVGGWDAWNVTEDADLGLRLARFGYRVETLASTTHEEAPATLRAWLAQRRRWQKGWTQTLLTMSRNPRGLARQMGAAKAAAALVVLISGVFGPLLGPALIARVVWDAVAGDLLSPQTWLGLCASAWWCACCALCAASIFAPALIGARHRGLRRELWLLPLMPVYYVIMCWAAWRALYELVFNPFHWSKTRHGLARTSRRRERPAPKTARPSVAGAELARRISPR